MQSLSAQTFDNVVLLELRESTGAVEIYHEAGSVKSNDRFTLMLQKDRSRAF
jgi:hypothetical protein